MRIALALQSQAKPSGLAEGLLKLLGELLALLLVDRFRLWGLGKEAITSASATSCDDMLACIDKPTARREYKSSKTAKYSQSSAVQT